MFKLMFIQTTKFKFKAYKEFYTKWIVYRKYRIFLYSLTVIFLKILVDLAFVISATRLFHSLGLGSFRKASFQGILFLIKQVFSEVVADLRIYFSREKKWKYDQYGSEIFTISLKQISLLCQCLMITEYRKLSKIFTFQVPCIAPVIARQAAC